MSQLFSSTATAHAAQVRGSLHLPLTLETSANQWEYAAWFARSAHVPTVPCMVSVALRVDRGCIGVGLLRAGSNDVSDEAIVDAATDVRRVRLFAAEPGQIGPLFVRNWSPAGSSHCAIQSIDATALDPALDSAPRPALGEPAPMVRWNHYFGSEGLTEIERLRASRFAALRGPAVMRFADGISFQVAPGDQSSRALYLSSTYEPNTLCVLRSLLRAGDTFIDIGANAGIITMAAAAWVGPEGRIVAFEPSGREFERLTDTVSRNGLRQVTAVRAALGAARGTAMLRVADAVYGGLNTLGSDFGYDGIGVATMETVDVLSLDDYVAVHQIPRIAAIKIDVEGFEEHVLEGAAQTLRRDRPALIVEVLGRALEAAGSGIAQLERRLAGAGYSFRAIDDDATLRPIASLSGSNGDNIVALPA